MVRLTAILVVLAIVSLAAADHPVFADDPPGQEDDGTSSLAKSDSNVSELLRDSVKEFRETGALPSAAQTKDSPGGTRSRDGAVVPSSGKPDELVRFDSAGNVQVYIHLKHTDDAALQQVRDGVARVDIEDKRSGIVQAWVAVEDLNTLAALDVVQRITPPDYAFTKAGSTVTEGDAVHRANLARDFGGLTGKGVKVGVIANGADAWKTARRSGDLPSSIEVNPNIDGEGHEGTALLEIVHDLAPEAELAFSPAGTSLAMVKAILWMANDAFEGEGADVIVDDLGYYWEPFFEDGIVAQAAADAVAGGVVFASAAGNYADEHYEGDFMDGGNGYHAFDGAGGSDISMRVRTPFGGVLVILQWNDKYGASGNDYDLYVCPAGLRPTTFNLVNDICDRSANGQNGDDIPLEIAALFGEDQVDIFIKKYSDTVQDRRLEMFTFDGFPAEYGVKEGGIVHHLAVPGVLAVGAFNEDDPGQDDLQSYSELGPSRIYFPSFETRLKPDVVAADGVSVTGSGGFPSHFFGTSAAAPHVAGIAALLIEAQRRAAPTMTKKQVADSVTQTIRESAIDLGPAGHDVEFGYGRADALAAVESIGTLTATMFTVDSTGDGADSDTTDGVCDDGNGNCTLRAAIQEANEADGSIIKFNISGGGTQTIQPASALPTITKKVSIDGFSQPGAGSGTFVIQLDGTNAGANADGLTISGEESWVRGLVINRFNGNGVVIQGSGGQQVIEANRIGTGVTGLVDMGNGKAGVSISGPPGVELRDNLISGNTEHGVSISGSATKATTIVDNLIGTDANGTSDLGNDESGIHISGAPEAVIANNVISGNGSHGVHLTGARSEDIQIAENHIGTTENGDSIPNSMAGVFIEDGASDNTVEHNTIAHNTGDGVAVGHDESHANTVGNTVRRNSIHSNGGVGIDLGPADGVTSNDTENDRDTGPNNIQNYPELTAVGLSDEAGSVAFKLDASKGKLYIVDFYASNSCDATQYGEGREWFGFAVGAPRITGKLSVLVDSFRGTLIEYSAPSGNQISATVTHDGNTSEFSRCIQSIPLPELDVSEESLRVLEDGVTSTTYEVKLASRPSSDATVALSVEGDEVVTVSPPSLTFTTGNWSIAQTVTVTAVGDANPEDGATVVLHTVTIDEKRYASHWLPVEVVDDDVPVLTLNDDGTILQEGFFLLDEGDLVYYPVVLAEEPAGDVRVKVYSSDTGALRIRSDSSSLTFTKDNYNRVQNVYVEVRTDSDADDERVTVYHETKIGKNHYVLATIRVLIIDSVFPRLTFSLENVSVDEGGTATYTVVPASEPSGNMTIEPVSSDQEAVTVSPASLTFTVGTNGNWESPQMVTVTGVGDDDEFNDVAGILHVAAHRGKDYELGFVEVTVNDGNRAPFFEERLETSRSVPENSTQGTKVGEPVIATDLNGDVLIYGIEHENDERFGIDRNTGQISVGPGLHLNFEAADSRRVTVTATDPGGRSDTIEVEILVIDVNEPPEVTGDDSEEFRENSTGTVGRFRATDPEEDSLVWSVDGADGVYFSIDDRGYLSFDDPPDFETSADANGDNVYEPMIVATDTEGNAGFLIARVTVTDVNEPPTISGRTDLSVNENNENFGETYTARDPEDPAAQITRWSVTGTDRGDFTINEEGQLSFRNNPDYEKPADSNKDNEYRVTVRASDGRYYGTLDVTVTVSEVNEAPEMSSSSKAEISYRENGTSSLYTYRATDPEGDPFTWSLSGADGGLFTISETGVLTFRSPPDYENEGDVDRDNDYEVTVQARDEESNTATLDVTVTVTDENEAPGVTGTSTFRIPENQELVGATYSGTDPENPGEQITRWSVTGTDSGDFRINEAGELSFRDTPDYEKPADSNKDNEYRVTVRASDGRYYGTLDVTVTVTAHNEAPEFAGNSKTTLSHRENGASILYTFRATDPEKGDIRWFVRGTDGGDFAIYKGMLTFRRFRDYENPGDSNRDNEYVVTVVAADREGVEGTLDVTVTVTDENEGPEVTGTSSFTIAENTRLELVDATYTGTDPENPGAQITRWSVTGTDGGDFEINEDGELSFRKTPDYEKPVDHNRDNEYRVTVRASDGRNYGALDVTVTVSDENEAPEISESTKTTLSYRENGSSRLYTYRANDPEEDDITWSVRGTDGNVFEISESGALTFRSPPDYENAGDTDRDNEYELTVVAGDQGGLDGTLDVTVTVTDQNEGPEVTGTSTFTIRENGELEGASYSGRDPEDPSLDITRWSVTGSDGGDFEINEDGELSFRKTPDYEKPVDHNRDNEYRVTVRASDGRYYGALDVTVTVTDENEAPEISESTKTTLSYRENGSSRLYTYRANDPEEDDITWSVRGTDGNVFEISESGALTFRSPPDYENAGDTDRDNEYELTVVAGDQGGLDGTLDVTVTVTDQNEGPEITGTTTFSMMENQELVGASYSGRDPEEPSLDITRWSVTGTDGGDFEINEDGELSFRKTPDYEKPVDHNRDNEYRVTVRASDGRYYGALDVTVTVTDENEAPEISESTKTTLSYRENGSSRLYTYRANDPEEDDITWSVRGTDGNVFEISESGALTFRSPPDYENAGDTDRDNEYELTVVAGDQGGLDGTLDVTVTVTDQNEGPEITGTTTFSMMENQELVGASYSATRPGGPKQLEITRWSVTGTDSGDFEDQRGRGVELPQHTGLREAGGPLTRTTSIG